MNSLVVYEIQFLPAAKRQIRKLNKPLQNLIIRKTDQLAVNPRPRSSEKLRGKENIFRLKVGKYRVIYTIKNRELLVLVIKIGHRREIYRDDI